MGSTNTSGFKLEVLTDASGKLGIKATVACYVKSQEVFRDEVKLWQARSREHYAEHCIKVLNGNLPPAEADKARRDIDAWLRREEERLKKLEVDKARSATASNNGKPKEMTEQEKAEALELLNDADLLARVQEDLTKMGIVDEERNKVLFYLIATSRKMPHGLAATIKASSSSGKNYLVNTVASLMPQEDVKQFTRMSAKALAYAGEDSLKNKLIICTEVVGKQEAEYLVRAFLSEGEITSLTTVRDFEDGPFRTQESKVKGPFAYVDTTTSFNIHPENATRVFEIYLNESEEQTRDIIRQQAKEAGPAAFHIKQNREEIQRIHWNAQRVLKADLEVVIPYSSLIDYPPQDVRGRRDFPKLLNLIRVVAFLHQYQREIKKREDGKEYIEATLFDYAVAYEIAKETFVETLDDLDKRSRDILEIVKRKLEEQAQQVGKKKEALEFDRDIVAQWCRKKKHKLNNVFIELEKEYFLSTSPSVGTEKRNYKLNWTLLDTTPLFEGLTTPEELEQKWEQMGNGHGEKPVDARPETLSLSPLSPLSLVPEEEK